MAQIIGIHDAHTTNDTTVYDPTRGSGSLKVGGAARAKVTLYGQEKDAATSGLARMNMILHDNPTALIKQGNTLANPLFTSDDGQLKTFDYLVANPPSATSAGVLVSTCSTIRTSASGISARRPPSRAITPTFCTSCARSRARVKAPASRRTACSFAAIPRPTSAGISFAGATSRASSVCRIEVALSQTDSDMTAQIFKAPYVFDFLGTANPRQEAELEQKLIDHIQQFLLELGQGFAFVGRQVHLEIGDSDFYLNLLFYHLRLRCFVVIELKAGKFEPGHVSQLNMYLNVVDDLLRHADDKPSIGLLLVKDKNRTVVKYSLAGYTKPIGVAQWECQITRSLPDDLKSSLPSVEEIEAELSGGSDD